MPQIDPAIPLIIANLTTLVVALFSVFVPLINDWQKRRGESRAAERARIEETTKELTDVLSIWRAGVYGDSYELQSKILQCLYHWIRSIWFFSDKESRGLLDKLREELEPYGFQHLEGAGKEEMEQLHSRLISQVHELTYKAISRIR